MKTINGWNQFVADAKHEPIIVPIAAKKKITVTYPTKRKMKQIFDEHANLILMPEEGEGGRQGAILTLLGDEVGQKLIEESEDLEGAPLEHMVMTLLVEFGLLNPSVLSQFTKKDDTEDGDEEGGDPNPGSTSSSSTGTAVSSNGTSPNGTSISSTTSAA